ncbi:ATP-binding protein [Prochlorococcus sp. MIT 1341]|uniref:ATP-binding protein n=1 Tax=Prochlorococcus sp. MIT 1341 TaxID=3096221 RepID=UPI002A75C7AD|nr:ATP-binding protein [Prochlorococcus sp. MIT 1341]
MRGLGCFRSRTFRWSVFRFPSTLQLSPYLKKLLEPVKCEETLLRLELGLHEAMVNAVKHGNSQDPRKFLRVRRILTPNWFVWQIQDEGKGLPHSKRYGCLPSELDSDRGRGLFLIHKCFDDVRWSNRGNRLQLSSRRKKTFIDEDSQDPSVLP